MKTMIDPNKEAREAYLSFRENTVPVYNDNPELEGNWIVSGDFHAPLHDVLFCNRLLKISELTKIRNLAIIGDAWEVKAFSKWSCDPRVPWSDEMYQCAQWLWVLYHSLDQVIFYRANHEDRIHKATNGQLTISDMIDTILCKYARDTCQEFTFIPNRITFSRYSIAYFNHGWMAFHPKGNGVNPWLISNKVAMKRQRHVICFHFHRSGTMFADDGKHQIVSAGMMADKRKFDWRNLDEYGSPEWQNGFVVLFNGHCELWTEEPLTNWSLFD